MAPHLHGAELTPIQLGLGANWKQFWLLVGVNAFVGAMVGLERTVVPLLAGTGFGVTSLAATVAFIATFGLAKALTNIVAGNLADRHGRKTILVAGWLAAIPVPLLLIWAPSWGWVLLANAFLGVNQGLAWSATLIMKIDLVGPRRRGLAMGLNEFAGYLAVALTAFATGLIAQKFGLRPEPFYLGLAIVATGLGLSVLSVRETMGHVDLELSRTQTDQDQPKSLTSRQVFAEATWRHPALSAASQAGLVNNLIDGMAWGIFPLIFLGAGLSVAQVAVLVAVYPAVWALLQLATGAWSDRIGRRWLIVGGMVVQGASLLAISMTNSYPAWLVASAALGMGTAMVYPTLLAVVGDVAHPSWRGSAVGMYRFWRDSGYVVGALLVAGLGQRLGLEPVIQFSAVLAILSGLIVALRLKETVAVQR